MESFLVNVLVFLAAAVAVVPLAERLRLGSVLGYLVAGLILGPFGLAVIRDAEAVLHFAEFGVVLLLFLIGLELKPRRLWDMRRAILGAGLSQLALSALVIGLGAWALDLPVRSAVVVGLVLALSSTAFALQLIEERRWTETVTGKTAFSILLFQDIAVIPMLAVVPLLGSRSAPLAAGEVWTDVAAAAGVIAAVLVLGPRVAQPLFRLVATTGSRELFTALSLLIVIGMAMLAHEIGMSMALGAFIGGVLLAESEYRHELEIDIEPFKGLLMGLFFMAVGMSMDVDLCLEMPLEIFGLTLALLVAKFAVLAALARLLGLEGYQGWQLAALLCQGGEFGFVVFGAAAAADVMDPGVVNVLTAVIALSMMLTPLVLAIAERVVRARFRTTRPEEREHFEPPARPVLIAGFGRFGQIVARLLNANGVDTTVIDHDPDQIALLRRFGHTVYYGDATRLDLLRAAHLGDAGLLVVALDDPEATLRLVDLAREHFSDVPLLVRVRNRPQAYELLDRGVTAFERETFAAAVNTGERALTALGFEAARARAAAELFRDHDERTLLELHAVRGDQKKLLSLVAAAREDLERLMREEERPAKPPAPAPAPVVPGP